MAEAENEVDDPGALAAVGCLHAISTILESVSSRLPHLFVQVEPTLVPIMHTMLTSDGQGMYSILQFVLFLTLFLLFTESFDFLINFCCQTGFVGLVYIVFNYSQAYFA